MAANVSKMSQLNSNTKYNQFQKYVKQNQNISHNVSERFNTFQTGLKMNLKSILKMSQQIQDVSKRLKHL